MISKRLCNAVCNGGRALPAPATFILLSNDDNTAVNVDDITSTVRAAVVAGRNSIADDPPKYFNAAFLGTLGSADGSLARVYADTSDIASDDGSTLTKSSMNLFRIFPRSDVLGTPLKA